VASYELLIKRSAAKELETLPPTDRRRIAAKIQHLSTEPRPVGAEKLSGEEKYRIRQGDYRVLYEIDDPAKTVTVVRIGHRGDVYR
jgi:mRNA interferase RelE/StbE